MLDGPRFSSTSTPSVIFSNHPGPLRPWFDRDRPPPRAADAVRKRPANPRSGHGLRPHARRPGTEDLPPALHDRHAGQERIEATCRGQSLIFDDRHRCPETFHLISRC